MITLPAVKGQKNNRKQEEAIGGKGEILNKKINQRLKRKEALAKMMNKLHDPDIA